MSHVEEFEFVRVAIVVSPTRNSSLAMWEIVIAVHLKWNDFFYELFDI